MNYDLIRRWKFIESCVELCPEIRFQCWSGKKKDGSYFSPKQYTMQEWKDLKILHLMFKESELLRQSIETKNVTELRIDIDFDFEKSINTVLEIYSKLKEIGIKSSVYYSGGKGFHIHSLISLKGLDLNYNNFDVDINKFNLEFVERIRNKDSSLKTPNYDFIMSRSQERKLIKEFICEKINILDKIDKLLLFSTQQLTLEGSVKRHKGNKINTAKKIYIDLEKVNTFDKIKNYCEVNETKTIINISFFNEVNILNNELIEFINKNLKNLVSSLKLEAQNDNKLNKCIAGHKKSSQNSSIKPEGINEDILKAYCLALIDLYKERNIPSTHQYTFYLVKLFDQLTNGDNNLIYKYVDIICQKLNISSNIESQMSKINSKGCWFGFKYNDTVYYRDDELILLKLKYSNIISLGRG